MNSAQKWHIKQGCWWKITNPDLFWIAGTFSRFQEHQWKICRACTEAPAIWSPRIDVGYNHPNFNQIQEETWAKYVLRYYNKPHDKEAITELLRQYSADQVNQLL